MNRTIVFCFCLTSLWTIGNQRAIQADEPESFKVPAGSEAAELSRLAAEYERLSTLRHEAIKGTPEGINGGAKRTDETLSDEEWLKAGREIDSKLVDPDSEMLPQFLEFAKSHPDSPYAFDALFRVIYRGGPQTGDVHGKPWQLKEEALDIAWKFHANDPRLFILLGQLGGSLPSHKTEAFFKQVLDKGPNKKAQAAAAYNLARYYATLAHAHQRSRQIKQKEHLLNFERFWKIVITPYLESHFPLNEDQNSAEVDRLLRLVAEKYSSVPATDWKLVGPGRVFVELASYPEPKTYGDLARAMQFELNNIVSGNPAPDIHGTDADGKPFRLSDYKGKVVLLVFSANWCGGCVALHPIERSIVEKYRGRPFVMLGVNRDDTRDTLQADTASGEITWRCWWDGMHGSICEAWNINGIPRIILLDHNHIFQNVAFSRFSTQEEFEEAIDSLLENVPARSAQAP
jgi:thiol-disulfide isomerase/thioredoxin